ncbi:sulfotransferase [Roseivivax sp. THAF197b]|uniref:tetratricopeptide repeat-containing sulfotransferase family protein n=1 Tax=Roseivivax sp. THAF197b TaxID=2588299 RepID=UPI0012694458|nr:sulfotransferase [Roseivivax sp. THAF197b]QFS84467.1 Sulfotransferase domain protein [Roseivivax sp. THAF197b]
MAIPPPPRRPQGGTLTARYQAALSALNSGRIDAARTAFTALAKERPNQPEIEFQLSRVAHLSGDFAARAAHLERALAAKPDEPALLDAATAAFAAAGNPDAALAAYDRTIAAAPSKIKPRADKALYLQQIGRFDAAEAIFRDLLRRHPREGSLYRMFFAAQKISADDPLLPELRKTLKSPKTPDEARSQGYFALAKALFDQGAGAKAFEALHKGNRLQRKMAPYDDAARRSEQLSIRAAQEGADLAPVGDAVEPYPVFVTGMPRSGTTLAEQIIAAHSRGTAGGELAHALKLVWDGFVKNGQMAPLRKIPDAQIAELARAYRARARRDTGAQAGVFTDKSIQNHLIYGFLARALPGAKFIVIHRDPRDIALSIYRNHFATGTHRYGNDLADIASAIKDFRASVKYWKGRLGEQLVEFRYEDLVRSPEPEARRMIAAAGLDWEEGCLNFHESTAAVKTLSIAQVRQPIHAGRAAAWTKFEAELAPFIEAWGDTPWD